MNDLDTPKPEPLDFTAREARVEPPCSVTLAERVELENDDAQYEWVCDLCGWSEPVLGA